MRFVTYSVPGRRPAPGIGRPDGGVISVEAVLRDGSRTADAAPAPATVAALLGSPPSVWGRLREAVDEAEADPERALDRGWLVARDQVSLHAPLGEKVLVLCTGANYRSHLDEMGEDPPEKAAWCVKSPNAVIGPGRPIALPARHADQVDYEGELCVVFGRACHAVSAEDANDYIAGFTILNDVSARDALPGLAAASTPEQGRWAWTDMLLGKQFPTFAPLGPAVVTVDEIPDPAGLHLTTRVNGVVMQDADLCDLIFDIPTLVEQMSRYFSFAPGDVLSTGTPGGVGVARRPPAFLRPGDTVEVEVDGIGVLSNGVAAAADVAVDVADGAAVGPSGRTADRTAAG
jgi:2-keto-4-pentenoate hydratase/2-oxohepta-3-ene-1,7-dioic acid hydratase in catechol pathway